MKEIFVKSHEVFAKSLSILGISPEAFAMSVGNDRSTVYRYRNGESPIPSTTLQSLIDLLFEHGVGLVEVLGIENENDYYYHVTSKEIVFPINVHFNDGRKNDFGNGFYLGENLRQSSTWGKANSKTLIYRFTRKQFETLPVLDFTSLKPVDWLNYIAMNRGKIDFNRYPSLITKYKKLEKGKGLIKGKIADSFSYEVLELFYRDKLDRDQAEYATQIMALGNQYCLKDQEFASHLVPNELIRFDEALSECFLRFAEKTQQRQNQNVEVILRKPLKRERLFSEFLKRCEDE